MEMTELEKMKKLWSEGLYIQLQVHYKSFTNL